VLHQDDEAIERGDRLLERSGLLVLQEKGEDHVRKGHHFPQREQWEYLGNRGAVRHGLFLGVAGAPLCVNWA